MFGHLPSVGLEDYLDVIKTPMDLTTIEVKLENSEYSEPKLILSDMRCEFTFSLNLSQSLSLCLTHTNVRPPPASCLCLECIPDLPLLLAPFLSILSPPLYALR
jgi:hypothetical protein